MAISAVIFDFDGVIVDSEQIHVAAWDQAFEKLTGQKIPPSILESLPGKSSREITKILVTATSASFSEQAILSLKIEILARPNMIAPLRPDFSECLKIVTSRNIPWGIASNAPTPFIKNNTKFHKIPCKALIGYQDCTTHKPSPEPFLKCASALRIPVSNHPQIVAFDDTPHGVKSAAQAGFLTIGVEGTHKKDVLMTAGAVATTVRLDHPDVITKLTPMA